MLARAITIFVLIFLSGMAAGVSVSALIARHYLALLEDGSLFIIEVPKK